MTSTVTASKRTGVRILAVALAAAAFAVAGCGGASSTPAATVAATSAPTSVSTAVSTATSTAASTAAASEVSSEAPKATASATLPANVSEYGFVVAAAEVSIKTEKVPEGSDLQSEIDTLFTDNPPLTDELDRAKVDAAVVKFIGADKAAALTSGDAIFGAIWDAAKKLEIDASFELSEIWAYGKANVPGWEAKLDAEYEK
jgi:glucose/arabinose dehydrogenase